MYYFILLILYLIFYFINILFNNNELFHFVCIPIFLFFIWFNFIEPITPSKSANASAIWMHSFCDASVKHTKLKLKNYRIRICIWLWWPWCRYLLSVLQCDGWRAVWRHRSQRILQWSWRQVKQLLHFLLSSPDPPTTISSPSTFLLSSFARFNWTNVCTLYTFEYNIGVILWSTCEW